jgi:hypothetical protein
MNTIKKVLQNELNKHQDHPMQATISNALFERLLEKKRRRDQKIRLCLQGFVFLLIVGFLCFVFLFSFTHVMPDTQTVINILLLLAFLVLMDLCHKILGLITWRRH